MAAGSLLIGPTTLYRKRPRPVNRSWRGTLCSHARPVWVRDNTRRGGFLRAG